MVVMEFGDIEERKRSRKSRHLAGQKITEEDDSSGELSLADIQIHHEKQLSERGSRAQVDQNRNSDDKEVSRQGSI